MPHTDLLNFLKEFARHLAGRSGAYTTPHHHPATDMDELLLIVRYLIRQLIVLLTSDTPKRPWSTGEITVMYQAHKSS